MAFHMQDYQRWLQLKGLFKEIRNVKSIDELQVKLHHNFEQAGHVVEDLEGYESYGKEINYWPFSGLGIYLTKFATQVERRTFFDQTLPHIALLAGNLVSYLSDRNISLERKGDDFEVDYSTVAGLLACGFLCAFPFSRNGTFVRRYNFAEQFGQLHRQSDQVAVASKLRYVLQYFRRLSVHDINLSYTSKVVKFIRKDINYDQLPDLETWLLNQSPLCPVKVDYKNDITVADGDFVELNFVSHYLEEGLEIKEDYEQNSLSEFLHPELLVAEWILQDIRASEAIIVKKDDWNNIHVAITGVGIRPSHVHNLRRNICNKLNRTWVGLSSYSTTTFNERIHNSEETLKNNNVSVAQNDASLLSGELTENRERAETTFVNNYSELLSKSIVKHAVENASCKLQLPKEYNRNPHEANEQTRALKNCDNNPHCRPFELVSSTVEHCTYGDLLIKSLMSSINGAVSLSNDVVELVSDQRICVSLHGGENLLKIKKLKRDTSVLTCSDESKELSIARQPSKNTQPKEINGTDHGISNVLETTQDPCSSWMKTMSSNLAQSITQSAVILASNHLMKNVCNNKISPDFRQINEIPSTEKHVSPELNTCMNSPFAVNCTDDMKCSAKEIKDVSDHSNGQETEDCPLATMEAFSKSEFPLHSGALNVFAEKMSKIILSDIKECQYSTPHLNEGEDEKHSLPIHDTRHLHTPAKEDVQFEMAMQWIVASAMGCPCLICYTNEEIGSKKIAWISDRAHKNGWCVSDFVKYILEYYQTKLRNHTHGHHEPQLFDFLQTVINEPTC